MTTTQQVLAKHLDRAVDIVLGDTTCTHTTPTREHLDECCADGVDCDNCGQPIEGLTGAMLAADGDEAAICRDCGLDHLDRFNA